MISKWRIASLIGLCIVSTLTCGFSSWIYVVNNKADVGDIDVNVGNITTNSTATIVFQKAKLFSFNKYGFAHEENNEEKGRINRIGSEESFLSDSSLPISCGNKEGQRI